MTLDSTSSEPHRRELSSDLKWSKLYSFLSPRVRQWVHFSDISSWLGQEDDVVDDIVQEAIIRTAIYVHRAESGEGLAVTSLERFSLVIARNYFEDLRRRDWRLIHTDDRSSGMPVLLSSQSDLSESVPAHMFLESILVMLPAEIVKFPDKQRRALLIDLANRMHFDRHPTRLQQAFFNVGIQLRDYQIPLPTNPVERSRHASLLSLAYKRIKELPCVKWYVSAA